MQKPKLFIIALNGVDYKVEKEMYYFVEQLIKENSDMAKLLDDAYFINRKIDNIEIVSQKHSNMN